MMMNWGLLTYHLPVHTWIREMSLTSHQFHAWMIYIGHISKDIIKVESFAEQMYCDASWLGTKREQEKQ